MVYRPPKKKTDGPVSPRRASIDPLSGPLLRAADGEELPQGDDRHLVAVDESYAGGDFEDRLWLFWRKQRANLVRLVVAIAVVVAGWQGWLAYQTHAVASLQTEYAALSGAPALLAFAQAHPQAALGKIAQLEGADALYADGKYQQAADAYAQAASAWGADDKGQRARLGEAVATLQAGDSKKGTELLSALTNDASATENFRAESAYYLAVLAVQNGDSATANKWLDRVKEFKNANGWISQAATLGEVMPLLGDLKVVKGYTPATPVLSEAPAPAPKAGAVTPTPAPASEPSAPPAPAKNSGLLNVPNLPALK